MNGWPRVKIGDVLSQDREYIARPGPREYKKLSVKLYGKGVVLDTPVRGDELKMQRHQLARAGQVILSEIWGKKGAIGLVPGEGDGALCTSHFFLFDLNHDRLDAGWMRCVLASNYLEEQLAGEARGTTGYAAVRPAQFLALEIPLPPLSEQQRLVARVDAIAARVSRSRTVESEIDAESEALSVLALSSLLPRGAPALRLGDLIARDRKLSYGVLVPGEHDEDGIPFVRVQDLSLRPPSAMPAKRISRDVDSRYARTRLVGDEVLIGVVGSIGKIGVASSSWAGANIARAVCRIAPGPAVARDYLAAVLSSSDCQRYFQDATRTLAQPTLNVGQLSEAPIPLPGLDEQYRIVAELNALQAEFEASKRVRAARRAELNALLPAVLDRAFAGEL